MDKFRSIGGCVKSDGTSYLLYGDMRYDEPKTIGFLLANIEKLEIGKVYTLTEGISFFNFFVVKHTTDEYLRLPDNLAKEAQEAIYKDEMSIFRFFPSTMPAYLREFVSHKRS